MTSIASANFWHRERFKSVRQEIRFWRRFFRKNTFGKITSNTFLGNDDVAEGRAAIEKRIHDQSNFPTPFQNKSAGFETKFTRRPTGGLKVPYGYKPEWYKRLTYIIPTSSVEMDRWKCRTKCVKKFGWKCFSLTWIQGCRTNVEPTKDIGYVFFRVAVQPLNAWAP